MARKIKRKTNRNNDRKKLRTFLLRYDTLVKEKDSLSEQRRLVQCTIGKVNSVSGTEKLAEFDALIERAKAEAAQAVCDIKAAIGTLPIGSMERKILELRYISRYSWDKICYVIHMERSRTCELESVALDRLLTNEEIRKKIS